jgi:muramoyltetrapeptide carboxypeptidase
VSSSERSDGLRTALLVSPAGPIKEEVLDQGLQAAADLGITIEWPPGWRDNILNEDGFLAGNDVLRAASLLEALTLEANALWMSRGGYGCIRTLETSTSLAGGFFTQRPRPLWGFSDGTALLAAWDRAGWPAWHAPPISQLPRLDAPSRARTLAAWATGEVPAFDGLEIQVPGQATAPLAGGNLAVLASLIGTPWAADLRDRIVLLEDIGEAPYAIDRLLTQMILSGAFEGALGFCIGQFTGLSDRAKAQANEVVLQRLIPLGLPMATGLPIGHESANAPMPYGAGAGRLAMLDVPDQGEAHLRFESPA